MRARRPRHVKCGAGYILCMRFLRRSIRVLLALLLLATLALWTLGRWRHVHASAAVSNVWLEGHAEVDTVLFVLGHGPNGSTHFQVIDPADIPHISFSSQWRGSSW